MKRTFVIGVLGILSLSGCNLSIKKQEPHADGSTSTEVHSGEASVKNVYVTYHGPEHLTYRFGKFFEIAADDNHIGIATRPGDADAQMEVTVEDQETHLVLNGKVLHVGFVLRGGGRATLDYCETVSSGGDNDYDTGIDYSRLYTRGLASKLKKSQPGMVKIFFHPIKGSTDSYLVQAIKTELERGDYQSAADAASADAILRAVGTTMEPLGAKGMERRLHIKISGKANFTYNGNHTFYKSLDEPVPAKSQVCLENAKSYFSPGYGISSDDFWGAAASAARAMAAARPSQSTTTSTTTFH